MGISPANSINLPHVSITLAACLTAATHYFHRREYELWSEIICWACLPTILKVRHPVGEDDGDLPINSEKQQYERPQSLWIVAGCLSIISFCRAEVNSLAFVPALTPLLILAPRGWGFGSPGQHTPNVSCFASLTSNVRLASLIAGLAIMTLSEWGFIRIISSCVVTGAYFIVYGSLMCATKHNTFLATLPPLGTCVALLARRVIQILLVGLFVRASILGFPKSEALPTLFLGVAKALAWRYTAQSASLTSWNIATMLATFSLLATRDPSMFSSEIQAFSNAVVSLLSLGQIWGCTPKFMAPRWPFFVLVLLPIAPYLANIAAIHQAQLDAPSFDQNTPHPVEALFNRSKVQFNSLLDRQSTSFEDARKEYENRYGVEPPSGFEEWYNMATASNSPLIDDFDSIHRAISPFLKLSGQQILDTLFQAQATPGIDLWLCKFSGQTSKTECHHPHRTFDRHISLLFDNLLMNVTSLPDVHFLVNHIDEPRVLFQSAPEWSSSRHQKIVVENNSRKPIWDSLTKECSRSPKEQNDINTFGLPFVTNVSSTQDLCQHPEYRLSHGLVMSPVSFRPIKGAVPVFSTGALSTMGDILFPSPAYTEAEFLYDGSRDIEWDKKKNSLYWAGSTTGGFALDSKWRLFHRQRFVELGQNIRKSNYYLRREDGVIQATKSSFLNGRLFDIVFTRVFQCQLTTCRDQDAYFKTKSWADKDEAFKSKLAFDIDGNGISGRYYKLLASRSVPLKQTLLREWHDDRLIPWLHYVPISQSMEELPELVFYLTSTEAGRKIAKQIAEYGQEWYIKSFREVDLSIYTFRLLLEMARLQDPQRQAEVISKR
ncbi:hypothetical protein FGRMN_11005 [Fusarium graminum]|nr:hypothetical protein FGRMN_11005 [Fusarium graminum]